MVFENVTLFEIHLDDARFENTVGGGSEEEYEESESEMEMDDPSGRARGMGRVLFSLGLALGMTYAVRRFAARRAGGDEEAVVIEDVDADVDETVVSD